MTKIRAKSKAAPAAEAREDAEDQRAVERYLADLRAGRVRTIRSEKVMLSLGMDPFEARLKSIGPSEVCFRGLEERLSDWAPAPLPLVLPRTGTPRHYRPRSDGRRGKGRPD